MKNRCARVPRKGSTAISLKVVVEEGGMRVRRVVFRCPGVSSFSVTSGSVDYITSIASESLHSTMPASLLVPFLLNSNLFPEHILPKMSDFN